MPNLDPPGRPLFATPRTPGLSTHGPRIRVVAANTGTPLMPWQEYAADVGTEQLPDGRFHYSIVVVTVPRQAGKTTIMRSVGVERAISYADAPCFYTAQTGKDARERWRDAVKALRSSAFRSQIKVREAAGSERVIFPNGSEFRCFAPIAAALHGYTPPLVMLDEAWDHTGARGDELMGAIVPAQITIPHRQLWIVSTAGTADSTFLRKWVEAGRAGAPGVCLVEYAAPDDADPYDPQTWLDYHPAINHRRPDGTPQLTVRDLQDAADRNSRSEFERAYLNRWTVVSSMLVPAEVWRALYADQTPPDPRSVTIAYDVAHDRSAATIVAAWRDGDKIRGRVVMHEPGSSWLVPAIMDLRDSDQPPAAIAADDGGPAREVTDQLKQLKVPIAELGARDYSTASGATLTAIREGTLTHDGHDLLAEAVAAAVTRPLSDGVAFSRRHSKGDIAPLVALTVAAWVVDHTPAKLPAPVAYFPRVDQAAS
jgi:phage terminase large subunit-like protein